MIAGLLVTSNLCMPERSAFANMVLTASPAPHNLAVIKKIAGSGLIVRTRDA